MTNETFKTRDTLHVCLTPTVKLLANRLSLATIVDDEFAQKSLKCGLRVYAVSNYIPTIFAQIRHCDDHKTEFSVCDQKSKKRLCSRAPKHTHEGMMYHSAIL